MRAGTCCVGKAHERCFEASTSLPVPLHNSSPLQLPIICPQLDSSASEPFLVDVYSSENVAELPTTSYPRPTHLFPTWMSITAPSPRAHAHYSFLCHLSMVQEVEVYGTKTFSTLCEYLKEERGRRKKERTSEWVSRKPEGIIQQDRQMWRCSVESSLGFGRVCTICSLREMKVTSAMAAYRYRRA